MTPAPVTDVVAARVLAKLGDSVTTDHISPAGNISPTTPAGHYLAEHGVDRADFNSYGTRRGNHEVMVRGTFANVRLRNQLAPGTEGGFTLHLPDGEQTTIYDAAQRYAAEGVPLVVLAGKEYGSGSSRDWAAKGTALLGIRAVIAESYERIHRSNLIGMGVLPLQYADGETAASLGLTGHEVFTVTGLAPLNEGAAPKTVTVRADGRRPVWWSSRPGSGSTRRWRPSTTATAASCPTCCARWPAERPGRSAAHRSGPAPLAGQRAARTRRWPRTAGPPPTMVQAWNTSWYPNTPGPGPVACGRRRPRRPSRPAPRPAAG